MFGKIPITITAIANGISIDFSLRFKSFAQNQNVQKLNCRFKNCCKAKI